MLAALLAGERKENPFDSGCFSSQSTVYPQFTVLTLAFPLRHLGHLLLILVQTAGSFFYTVNLILWSWHCPSTQEHFAQGFPSSQEPFHPWTECFKSICWLLLRCTCCAPLLCYILCNVTRTNEALLLAPWAHSLVRKICGNSVLQPRVAGLTCPGRQHISLKQLPRIVWWPQKQGG